MDSTLIFVALFVTVITAFQSPVSQNLSPNPVDLTNNILGNLTTMVYGIAMLNGLKVPGGLPRPEPFRPARTDQIVTLFWYTALLMSLITAICSLLGRQWVEHLTKKPDGRSYKDKSWRLDIRGKLAEKFLRPLLDSLHPILIASIVLFIVGLLFQLWSTSFSAGKPPVLMLTSSLGSVLILGTAAVTVYTLVHGVRRDESPFTTSTSLAIRRLLPSRFIKAVSTGEDLYTLLCSATKQMGETHHFDQVSTVSFSKLLNSTDLYKNELAVDTIVSVLGSDASLKAKQTVAWNLCNSTSHWRQFASNSEIGQKRINCHSRLRDALKSAELDTPSSQKKVVMTFVMAQMAVLLKFNGVQIYLNNVEDEDPKNLFLSIFKFDPKECFDKKILDDAKRQAYYICQRWAGEDPNPDLFDLVNNDRQLLPAIVREHTHDYWKYFVLQRLNVENVTSILGLISTKFQDENADYLHLFKKLRLILFSCQLPFIFPRSFDISNLIKFATVDERRFDGKLVMYSSSATPVDVLLSCLSLMDGALLDAQQNLLELLDSLDGHEDKICQIRKGIPLTPASIARLRDCITLSAMPLFWQWTS